LRIDIAIDIQGIAFVKAICVRVKAICVRPIYEKLCYNVYAFNCSNEYLQVLSFA